MLYLGLVAAMVALGGFTVQTARERGRSGALWAALSIAAVFAGITGQAALIGHAAGPDTYFVSGLLMLVVPLLCMVAVLGALWLLPEKVPEVAGARWTMHRLPTRDQTAADLELAFDGIALHIGDVTVQPAEVRELVADGECLRIAWAGGGEVTLMPADKKPRSARERMKRSQALERHLNVLLRRHAAA